MGFLSLLKVASFPMIQVLVISSLGAFMATDYLNLLPSDARRSLNKIVFVIFTPSLLFSSLARTVNLQDIISWWFMPVNIGLTFLIGGIFGWIVVKILKPEPHLRGLIIAMCSGGNLGNILLIVIPAICKEDGSPFGDGDICSDIGLSYVSLSMASGALYLWTYTFHLIQSSQREFLAAAARSSKRSQEPNKDLEANERSALLDGPIEKKDDVAMWAQGKEVLHRLGKELLAPPVIGACFGFLFGSVSWLRNVLIGRSAPLRVLDDSIKLLADGTIPCITLILGGNLRQGLRQATLGPSTIIAVICVKFILLPAIGIAVVRAASELGFLHPDPLYHFMLMIQFAVPPAMNIGTMTQLFNVAQEECSVLFLWTYLVAALALTAWSTVFMWFLA